MKRRPYIFESDGTVHRAQELADGDEQSAVPDSEHVAVA